MAKARKRKAVRRSGRVSDFGFNAAPETVSNVRDTAQARMGSIGSAPHAAPDAPTVTLGSIAAAETGVRFDNGKLRYDLIPAEWDKALAQVLTYGAQKYAERNWEKGMDWGRIVGALRRHLAAWLQGETFDTESGLHHMAQLAWNALAALSYEMRNAGTDNVRGTFVQTHRDEVEG